MINDIVCTKPSVCAKLLGISVRTPCERNFFSRVCFYLLGHLVTAVFFQFFFSVSFFLFQVSCSYWRNINRIEFNKNHINVYHLIIIISLSRNFQGLLFGKVGWFICLLVGNGTEINLGGGCGCFVASMWESNCVGAQWFKIVFNVIIGIIYEKIHSKIAQPLARRNILLLRFSL